MHQNDDNNNSHAIVFLKSDPYVFCAAAAAAEAPAAGSSSGSSGGGGSSGSGRLQAAAFCERAAAAWADGGFREKAARAAARSFDRAFGRRLAEIRVSKKGAGRATPKEAARQRAAR